MFRVKSYIIKEIDLWVILATAVIIYIFKYLGLLENKIPSITLFLLIIFVFYSVKRMYSLETVINRLDTVINSIESEIKKK